MEKGEKILATRHSPFTQIVVTEDESGLRSLRFGESEARQSVVKLGEPQYLELPYIRVLPNTLAFAGELSQILFVGLGGGTLPAYFRHEFQQARIDVVELDPVVLEVAKAYFGFTEDSRLRVFIEDARDYIERCENQYDLIVLDGFDEESVPAHLNTLEFLQAVRKALTPQGIAVANIWGRCANRLYDHALLTYREAFDDLYILDVPEAGTKIFVALQRKRPMTRSDLLDWAATSPPGVHPASVHSLAGFRNSDQETLRGGGVLRD